MRRYNAFSDNSYQWVIVDKIDFDEGTPWTCSTISMNDGDFWQAKFRANVERDARVSESLRDLGWRVFVVWACSISDGAMARLAQKIRTDVDG